MPGDGPDDFEWTETFTPNLFSAYHYYLTKNTEVQIEFETNNSEAGLIFFVCTEEDLDLYIDGEIIVKYNLIEETTRAFIIFQVPEDGRWCFTFENPSSTLSVNATIWMDTVGEDTTDDTTDDYYQDGENDADSVVDDEMDDSDETNDSTLDGIRTFLPIAIIAIAIFAGFLLYSKLSDQKKPPQYNTSEYVKESYNPAENNPIQNSICPYCGKGYHLGDQYCGNCGRRI